MQLPFGLTILRTKKIPAGLQAINGAGSWYGRILESFSGAWQQNVEIRTSTVLTYSAVFACVTLIAADVAKLCLRLVEKDKDGVWSETESPAFSPVLRKPNRYQNIVKFVEQWIVSKLIHGNTYVLKQRDGRGVVTALYILDASKVHPLVAPDGSVFYELGGDPLSSVEPSGIVVPAREIIHDTMVALYHPLVGVSPLTACGLAATQGLAIQNNSTKFFTNGAQPGGVLSAPGAISDPTAARLKAYWDNNFTGDNAGKVAVLGDGLKYDPLTIISSRDAQMIDQLKWTGETVCTAYHVPAYMIGVGPPPPYANIEPLLQQYYSQCIQSLLTNFEKCMDDGLGISEKIDGHQYGVEFNVDDLIWMDTATKTKAALDSIGSGGMSPNESRKKYFGLGPVKGGDTPYLQMQNYSLAALARRDEKPAPSDVAPTPVPTPQAPMVPMPDEDEDKEKSLRSIDPWKLFGAVEKSLVGLSRG